MPIHPPIPRSSHFDCTLGLLKEGYSFVPGQHRATQSDIFTSRIMLKKAIFISGPEAAQLFYNEQLFTRKNAVPQRIQKTLFGRGGVQTLDNATHRHRKAMFMALMGQDSRTKLSDLIRKHWNDSAQRWQNQEQIVFFEEIQALLFRAACDWAGIAYSESEVAPCAQSLGKMIDAFGGVGPRYWQGKKSRKRMEYWAAEKISVVRGEILYGLATPLQVVALHRDLSGELLSIKTAAVEILNVIRPIIAIATYAAFIAHAFYHHPAWKLRLLASPSDAMMFVHEVRRLYPFTPFIGARTREKFSWKGYLFPKNRLVILDIHGLNHDPRIWDKPDEFIPERFQASSVDELKLARPLNLIPQGGGDYHTGHRCAGEWITIDVMTMLAQLLARMSYIMPDQDLSIDTTRMPTLPKSKVIMTQIIPSSGY